MERKCNPWARSPALSANAAEMQAVPEDDQAGRVFNEAVRLEPDKADARRGEGSFGSRSRPPPPARSSSGRWSADHNMWAGGCNFESPCLLSPQRVDLPPRAA